MYGFFIYLVPHTEREIPFYGVIPAVNAMNLALSNVSTELRLTRDILPCSHANEDFGSFISPLDSK
jgi:hypothetical protein